MADDSAAPATLADYTPSADTWDHVVRAVAHTRHAGAAAVLMRATREHAHDAELLWLTRAVQSGKSRETLLVHATRLLRTARVGEILAACPTPASRAELLACGDRDNRSALHWACHLRYKQREECALVLVELLLGAGADPLVRAHDSNIGSEFQPIHLAARWSARLVQRLVQAGAPIDGDIAGTSTLRSAAVARTAVGVCMIPALVALGARETHGGAVMHIFAFDPVEGAPPPDGDVAAALTVLVSVGCSLVQLNAEGDTPLDLASLSGNAPVVRALLAAGAPATTCSLVHAVKHPGVLRLLLAAGAPVGELVTPFGGANISPLMQASRKAALESVQLLLAAGATAACCNERGWTALMFSLRSKSPGSAAVLGGAGVLLAAGADVGQRNQAGNAALHVVAMFSRDRPWAAAAARLLLESGADGRVANNAGKTPVQCVPAKARSGELYRLLLEAEGA